METRSNHILVGGVVLAMLAAVLAFIIWLSQVPGEENKEYDVFFRQAVDGLVRGAAVTFSGVPVGTVQTITLEPKTPEFVRVRIQVREDTPVLQGTTASLGSVGFTGAPQVQLEGAARGAPPITQPGPYGVPVIPTRPGGFAAILNTAPELLNRVSTLTERLSELLSERNQDSIAGILDNTERLSESLADRGPEIAATLAEARVVLQRAGAAADRFGRVADSTANLLDQEGRPLVQDLRNTIQASEQTIERLNTVIGDAQPGVQALSKQTIPEIGQLVRDLRETTENLRAITARAEQEGATSILGAPKLPDYKPGRTK
jgi:phospholipid/cholesterol/gamma-HCH transport system substrate-binding protein